MALVYNVNNSPQNEVDGMFQVKQFLKSIGWSVPSSSDGSTFYGAGDILTGSGTGPGNLGNTGAWFWIQEPAGSPYGAQRSWLCENVATNINASASTAWYMAFSPADGFTIQSSNPVLTCSVATDQVLLNDSFYNSQTDFGGNRMFGGQVLPGQFRLNMSADNSGSHRFFIFAFPAGGGTPLNGFFMDDVSNTLTNDLQPWMIYCNGYSSQLAENSLVTTWMHAWVGNLFPTFQGINGNSYDFYAPTSAFVQDPQTNKDLLFPVIIFGGPNVSAGATSLYKGVCSTVRWEGTGTTSSPRAAGSILNQATPGDTVVCGVLTFPWNSGSITI